MHWAKDGPYKPDRVGWWIWFCSFQQLNHTDMVLSTWRRGIINTCYPLTNKKKSVAGHRAARVHPRVGPAAVRGRLGGIRRPRQLDGDGGRKKTQSRRAGDQLEALGVRRADAEVRLHGRALGRTLAFQSTLISLGRILERFYDPCTGSFGLYKLLGLQQRIDKNRLLK